IWFNDTRFPFMVSPSDGDRFLPPEPVQEATECCCELTGVLKAPLLEVRGGRTSGKNFRGCGSVPCGLCMGLEVLEAAFASVVECILELGCSVPSEKGPPCCWVATPLEISFLGSSLMVLLVPGRWASSVES